MDTRLKKIVKWIPILSFAISLILFLVCFPLSGISAPETYTYKNGMILSHSWHNYFEILEWLILGLILFALILSTVICIILAIQKKEKVIGKVVLSWLVGFLCFGMLLFGDMAVIGWRKSEFHPEWFEFTDGQYTIVIEETSWLLGGSGTIYQVQEDASAVKIGWFGTDNGFRNKGRYRLNWFADHAEISYTFKPGYEKTAIVYFE